MDDNYYMSSCLYFRSNEEEIAYVAQVKAATFNATTDPSFTFNSTAGPGIVTPTVDRTYYIVVYCASLAFQFIVGCIRTLVFFKIALEASFKLHNSMFGSMLRANQRFFDNNPVGKLTSFVLNCVHMLYNFVQIYVFFYLKYQRIL